MVPSTPGARTVTAGPAMRTSGCWARIAGSMNPQLRKWPMVAGSARTSFCTRRVSSEEGSGLRVNTAELLHVGERAVAQPADIAAGVEHVVAPLEHLAPRRAGMRYGAHRLAALPYALLGARDQLRHFGMLQVAELADGAGEVVWPDEEDVDTVDRGDRLHVVHGFRRLDLADDEELVGRRLAVFGGINPIVGGTSRAQRRAAPARGRIAAGGNYRPRIFRGFHIGHHDSFDAGVQHALEIVCIVRGHADHRSAVGRRRHRLQRV